MSDEYQLSQFLQMLSMSFVLDISVKSRHMLGCGKTHGGLMGEWAEEHLV